MISQLGREQQAALVASALQRMQTILSDLVPEWRSLGVPSEAVIEKYREAARGGSPGPVAWDVDGDGEGGDGTFLQEMLDAATELFGTANQGLQDFDQRACATILSAAEELAEAADTWAAADDAPQSVQIDSGTPLGVEIERQKQGADAQSLISEGRSVPELLETLLADARRSGDAEAARLRALHRESPPKTVGSETVGPTRQDLLMGVLRQLKPKDWAGVESCARRLDRPAALAAARLAMKQIGVHASHELLRAASTSLGLEEGSPVWEVTSRALVAAAAWDGLPTEPRQKLVECLLQHHEVLVAVSKSSRTSSLGM
jgi:hypothetical protein